MHEYRKEYEKTGILNPAYIKMSHIEEALHSVKPSVTISERKKYEKVKEYIESGKSALEALELTKKNITI